MAKQTALERAIAQMDGEIAALQTAREFLIRQRPKPVVASKPAAVKTKARSADGPTLRMENA